VIRSTETVNWNKNQKGRKNAQKIWVENPEEIIRKRYDSNIQRILRNQLYTLMGRVAQSV
jgi:hypothetical protein